MVACSCSDGAIWAFRPVFDSLVMIRRAGFLFFRDLRTFRGLRRESAVP